MMKNKFLTIGLSLLMILSGCSSADNTESVPDLEKVKETTVSQDNSTAESTDTEQSSFSLEEIPDYSNSPTVTINNDVPEFEEYEIQEATISYETYSDLDSLGRAGVAMASVGQDLMPTEDRESLSSVTPSGWDNEQYSCVDGSWIYNRSHLIGFQLTGEQANALNLITGTRYMNVEGMLPYENKVADYVDPTGNHVLYRITPIYEGNNLVASGVQMEAYSVEDQGQGVQFNVYCYNVQPGVVIDYKDGSTEGTSSCPIVGEGQEQANQQNTSQQATNEQTVYISKTGSKYHSNPNCSNMKNPTSVSLDEAQSKGLEPCKKCW